MEFVEVALDQPDLLVLKDSCRKLKVESGLLEQHFGHLRHIGSAKNNPTVVEAYNSLGSLRTINCLGLESKKGTTKVCSKPRFNNYPK